MQNKKLTLREKILVSVAAIFLSVFAFVYFVFIPVRDEHTRITGELETARLSMTQAQIKTAAIPGIRDNIQKIENASDEFLLKYNKFTYNEILEREFTRFLPESQINPASVQITGSRKSGANTMNGFVNLTLNIKGEGTLDNLLMLSDYANSVYSYRLISMDASGDPISGKWSSGYIIEAMLYTE